MIKLLTDLDLEGKRVLLRADLNVPLDKNGNITDDTRIYEVLPTIRYILKQGAKLIVCSHLGRPKGFDPKYSLFPVAQQMIRYLINKTYFAIDVIGNDAKTKVENLKAGEMLLLENLRFHKEEEMNDICFARELASMADIYINDAFGTLHRKHASIYRVAKLLPENAVGFLVGKELSVMNKALKEAKKPFITVLGGAKVSDKIGMVKNLLDKADELLIGGAMAFTFLKALNYNIGKSKVEDDSIEIAKEIIKLADLKGKKLILPVDVAATEVYSPSARAKYFNINKIPSTHMALDIGPKTIKMYKKEIKKAKTVIWNGPMGVFEFSNFSTGTTAIAKAIAKNKGLTIVGGGDSVSAVKAYGLEKKISHISTGGGASLGLLAGNNLPGLDALTQF